MSEKETTKEHIAYCGVYCGACGLRLAGAEQDKRHLTPKALGHDPKELEYWTSCPGCRAGSHRADCDFRICAASRGHEHCIQCNEFPCQLHKEFNSDGVPHHAGSLESLTALKELGPDGWLALQKQRWTCDCGARLSWYLKHCLKCGKPGRPV